MCDADRGRSARVAWTTLKYSLTTPSATLVLHTTVLERKVGSSFYSFTFLKEVNISHVPLSQEFDFALFM